MGKVMRYRGFTIRELKNGLFSMTYKGEPFDDNPVHEVGTFNAIGALVYEMADNNDEGREANHRMCKAFNRVFFEY